MNDYLSAVRRPGQTVNPLFALWGVRIDRLDHDAVALTLPFHPGSIQGAGIVAGGVVATLLDEAMAHAVMARLARQHPEGEAPRVATTNLEVRYFLPARPGVDITATATVIRAGRRAVFLEASAHDPQERELARGSATFLVLD